MKVNLLLQPNYTVLRNYVGTWYRVIQNYVLILFFHFSLWLMCSWKLILLSDDIGRVMIQILISFENDLHFDDLAAYWLSVIH